MAESIADGCSVCLSAFNATHADAGTAAAVYVDSLFEKLKLGQICGIEHLTTT